MKRYLIRDVQFATQANEACAGARKVIIYGKNNFEKQIFDNGELTEELFDKYGYSKQGTHLALKAIVENKIMKQGEYENKFWVHEPLTLLEKDV
jgi:hypothetical protein